MINSVTLDVCVLSGEGVLVGKVSHVGTLNGFHTGKRYRVIVEEVEDLGVCDTLQTPSEVAASLYGHTRLGVSEVLQRYALLAGQPRRTDEEEGEVQGLLSHLLEVGCDPGWRPVKRSLRR